MLTIFCEICGLWELDPPNFEGAWKVDWDQCFRFAFDYDDLPKSSSLNATNPQAQDVTLKKIEKVIRFLNLIFFYQSYVPVKALNQRP